MILIRINQRYYYRLRPLALWIHQKPLAAECSRARFVEGRLGSRSGLGRIWLREFLGRVLYLSRRFPEI